MLKHGRCDQRKRHVLQRQVQVDDSAGLLSFTIYHSDDSEEDRLTVTAFSNISAVSEEPRTQSRHRRCQVSDGKGRWARCAYSGALVGSLLTRTTQR